MADDETTGLDAVLDAIHALIETVDNEIAEFRTQLHDGFQAVLAQIEEVNSIAREVNALIDRFPTEGDSGGMGQAR
jgi:hypothetical protein